MHKNFYKYGIIITLLLIWRLLEMNQIYVFGHKNPDTDSVCASISLAYLKQKIGQNCIPVVLSHINEETKFVLNYFKVKEPKYLNDVHLQVKDIKYNHDFFLDHHSSIYKTYRTVVDHGVSAIPIVDKKKFLGIITLKDMARDLIDGTIERIHTSYDNILDSLDGQEVLRFDDEIIGNLMSVTFKSTTFIENIPLTKGDILIVGDRHSVIEHAVSQGVKLIILVGNSLIKDVHLELARKNNVNIIKTSLRSLEVIKRMSLCNYVDTLINEKESITVEENMYLSDFMDLANKLKHTHYPVVDKKGNCLGLLRIANVNDVVKKQVILVDHNEIEQSIDGLEEADILEIIDHHKLGNISTKSPISFRNMAVGSTCTIVYILYTEYGEDIKDDIKGLLLSGILSDTLLFKSPTTTELDYYVAKQLASQLHLDYQEYAMKMFKASSNYHNVSNKLDVLYKDFKEFKMNDRKIGVGQINTLSIDDIMDEKEEYIRHLNEEAKEKGYDMFLFAVTDIIHDGSYMFFNDEAKVLVESSFNLEDASQGVFLKGYLSRKKQIIPSIMDALDK